MGVFANLSAQIDMVRRGVGLFALHHTLLTVGTHKIVLVRSRLMAVGDGGPESSMLLEPLQIG